MGQGGFLWIINATSKTLKLNYKHDYQMNTWDFNDVPSQSQKKFYIEYTEFVSKYKIDDKGEAVFIVDGTEDSFELLIRWPYNEGECGLKVDWSHTNLDKYVVFPPTLPGDDFAQLGWLHNGYLALLLMEKGVATSITTEFPGVDTIISDNATYPYPITTLCSKWMEYYSDLLGRLTLTEMTLPGSHDSGTHSPTVDDQNPLGILSDYIRTQNTPLRKQLSDGIRVLDLRIGQEKPGDYVITHNEYRTNYTLSVALKEVTDFIDATEKEIVVLDFHRFVSLGSHSPYDYTQLKQQITRELAGYYLPASEGHNRPLKDIWALHGKKRIVVAWNAEDIPDAYMWPGVNQHWYSHAGNLKELYPVVKSDMLNPPVNQMWAACSFAKAAFDCTPRRNAELANPTMTRWYFGGSTFCEKGNIISVDFYDECSNIVQACVIGSLLLAGSKK